MLTNSKKFNKEYNLNAKDLTLFKRTSLDKFISSQIMGKPTTRGKDITKRFFKNPWTIVALVISSCILMLTILGPMFSQYDGEKPISSSLLRYTSELPPSGWGTTTLFKDIDYVNNIKSIETSTGINIITNTTYSEITDLYEIEYSPYKLLQALDQEKRVFSSIIGTDSYGRDIWTRVLIGTRNALSLSLFVLVIQTVIGVTIGSYLGFHIGQKIDTFMMRVIEIFNSIPGILWIVILIGVFGQGFWGIAMTLTISNIFGPIGSTRMFMISVKDSEFLLASKAVGSSKLRIIYIEALPLIIGKLASSFVSNLMGGVFALSSLAFLGFILDGETTSPNLGLSLYSSRTLVSSNPWAVAFPVVILLSSIASLKVIAIGLHDALDIKATKGV